MQCQNNRPGNGEFPGWLRELLASRPVAGTGLHQWIFSVARGLKPWRTDPEIQSILTAATADCGRDTAREITEAIRNAQNDWKPDGMPRGLRAMLPPPSPAVVKPRWPAPDWAAITRIAQSGAGLADLWERSPERLEGMHRAGDFLNALFPGDPLLCLAKSSPADALTARRWTWGSPEAFAFIVPSPMTATKGRTLGGKPSLRCLDNTGPRRFLVVEFDFAAADKAGRPTHAAPLLAALARERIPRNAPDLCAAILLHLLAEGAPLALAVSSGGKSVHGWFPTYGASDDDLRRFFAHACSRGADPATWTRCQLVRVPGGTRDDGRRQLVYYFNPAALPGACTRSTATAGKAA